MTPKAVLFDLDGTLLDRDASFLEFVQDQYDCFAAELERISREVFVRRVVEMDGHGYVDKRVVYRDLAREFCLPEATAERLTIHFLNAYASYSQCFPEVPSALGAGEFVTNPEYFSEAARRLPANWRTRNLQIVLRVPVVNRIPGRPRVLATYLW